MASKTVKLHSDAVDPFAFDYVLPWYRIPQVMFMSFTVAPLRLVSMLTVHAVAWLLANVILINVDNSTANAAPFQGWRRICKETVHWLGRIAVSIGGFTSIVVRGKQASQKDVPTLVCAPHSTFLDAVVIFLTNKCPAVIAKYETSQYPFFGKLLRVTQPIFVYRDDRNSKLKVIEELKRRSDSGGLWHQQLIFPEGTTTNRKALLPFKVGAFIPGKPVQPVTIRYTDRWDTVTWTWKGVAPGWLLFWLSLCKFRIGLVIDFLPVYYPSDEERENPALYADNVRQYMAKSLKIPCSELTIEDARKMVKRNKTTKDK